MYETIPSGEVGFDDPTFDELAEHDNEQSVYAWDRKALRELSLYWVEVYGGEGEEFSEEQEIRLASDIQKGLEAQKKLSSLKRVSKERRNHLEQAIADGARAEQALVETHLRFAFYFARESVGIRHNAKTRKPEESDDESEPKPSRHYAGTYAPLSSLKSPTQSLEDRYNMAAMGLVTAARTYTPQSTGKSKNKAKFISYAAWQIQQNLERGISNSEHVGARLPDHIRTELRAYFGDNRSIGPDHTVPHHIQKFIDLTTFEPMPDPQTGYEGSADDLNDPWSQDDRAGSLAEVWDDPNYDDTFELRLASIAIKDVLDTLRERPAGIVRRRHGLTNDRPMVLDEIGKVYGVTRERIRQIERKTLSDLRHPSRSTMLRGYDEMLEETRNNPLVAWRGDSVVLRTRGENHGGGNSVFTGQQAYETYERDESSEGAVLAQELESWQAYAGEGWELPERKGIMISEQEFDKVRSIIETAAPFMYTKRYTERAKTPYPVLTLDALRETLDGHLLSADQINALWQDYMATSYDRLKETLGETFDQGRVGQLFSRIIREFAAYDGSEITLQIPEKASGQINNLASNLDKGIVRIIGDVGDFCGANNSGGSSVFVYGSCGKGAGMQMQEYASLFVEGSVGVHFGHLSAPETLAVNDTFESYRRSKA